MHVMRQCIDSEAALMKKDNEFPLSETPDYQRKGFFPIAMVLFSFTFFTGTMFAGGQLGTAFPIKEMLWLAIIGNGMLAVYAAVLGMIAARSGLNTVLMGRFCFGEVGSKISDFILGFAELGWYAWGTATIAISLVKILDLSSILTLPLMVLFGIGFCLTALVGFRGLDLLSRISIPVMLILLILSMVIATHHAGGWIGMTQIEPTSHIGISEAITIIFGTFASGATQATNWTRQARSSRTAIWASMISFLIGNGLMVIAGAWCAVVYQQADIIAILIVQGLSIAAVIMLCLNLGTIQGPTIYNVSAAACHFFRSTHRRAMTLISASVGILLAIGGMSELLIPFLKLLGSIIPPIGGVIIADYWIYRKGHYPLLSDVTLPKFNYCGLISYASGSLVAYFSPWIAPLIGIAVSAVIYALLIRLTRPLTVIQD